MKKLLSLLLAFTMILTLTAGCGTTAAPDPDPEPVDDAVEVTPVAAPAAVEGVVKEASPSRIVVTLNDGTSLAFDVTGIADLDVGLGDTVKVEYTGEIGSMVAVSVTVTEKAEVVTATVTGIVTKIEDGFVFLALENGTEAALKAESVEEYDVEVGDTLTIEYVDDDTDGGVDVVSVGVTKAEKEVEEEAPATDTQSGNSSATGNSGSTGSTSSGSTGSSQASQVSAKKADETYPAVVIEIRRFDGYNSTVFQHKDGSTNTVADAESVAIGLNGRNFQVGDEVVFGWVMNGTGRFARELSYIELTKAGSGSYDDDAEDYDDDDDDDEEDYTPSSKPSSSSGSSQSEDAGDVYEAIRLINAERVKNGLSELEIDSTLMEMAAVRAEEQVESVGHTRPDGREWSTVFSDFNSALKRNGEIAHSGTRTASSAVSAWINSSAHHDIMLKSDATKIGVGFYYDSNAKYKSNWVAIFAK